MISHSSLASFSRMYPKAVEFVCQNGTNPKFLSRLQPLSSLEDYSPVQRQSEVKTHSGHGRLPESPPSRTTWRLRQRRRLSTDGREAAVLLYFRRGLLNCSANLLVSHVMFESGCSPRRMEPTRYTRSCLACLLISFWKCAVPNGQDDQTGIKRQKNECSS